MGQIGRAAEQIRQRFRDRVDHQLRRLPGGNIRPFGSEAVAKLVHRVRIFAGQISIQRIVKRRATGGIETPGPLDPGSTGGLPARADLAPSGHDGFRNLERLVRPVQRGAGLGDFVGAERRAMRFFGALPVRRAEADDRAARDQRRTVIFFGTFDRRCDRFGIVPVDTARRPARGLEPRKLVIRTGQRRRAVDRNLVVVEQHDQPVEPQMSGQRNRFVAEALHQAAVAGDHIGIVIDEIVAETRIQQAFGQRHADRRRNALPQRSGGRLDAGRMAIFGMARGFRSPLPEGSEFVDVTPS